MALISESPIAAEFLVSGLIAAFGIFLIVMMIKNNFKPNPWLLVPKGQIGEKVYKNSDPTGYHAAFFVWLLFSVLMLFAPLLIYFKERPF
jgi:hypothetical protein